MSGFELSLLDTLDNHKQHFKKFLKCTMFWNWSLERLEIFFSLTLHDSGWGSNTNSGGTNGTRKRNDENRPVAQTVSSLPDGTWSAEHDPMNWDLKFPSLREQHLITTGHKCFMKHAPAFTKPTTAWSCVLERYQDAHSTVALKAWGVSREHNSLGSDVLRTVEVRPVKRQDKLSKGEFLAPEHSQTDIVHCGRPRRHGTGGLKCLKEHARLEVQRTVVVQLVERLGKLKHSRQALSLGISCSAREKSLRTNTARSISNTLIGNGESLLMCKSSNSWASPHSSPHTASPGSSCTAKESSLRPMKNWNWTWQSAHVKTDHKMARCLAASCLSRTSSTKTLLPPNKSLISNTRKHEN